MTNVEDDALDRLLRADACATISDAGFSERVVKALPRAAPRRVDLLLVPAAALLGSILATVLLPADVNVAQGVIDLVERHRLTPAAMAELAIAGALLISAVVLAADAD